MYIFEQVIKYNHLASCALLASLGALLPVASPCSIQFNLKQNKQKAFSLFLFMHLPSAMAVTLDNDDDGNQQWLMLIDFSVVG